MGTAYDGQDSYFCNGFRSTDLYTVINNKMHSFEKKSRLHISAGRLRLRSDRRGGAAAGRGTVAGNCGDGAPSRQVQTGRGSGADHRDPQRAANGFRAVGPHHRGARRHADAARLSAGGPLRGAHAPCRTGSLVRRLVRFAAFRDAGRSMRSGVSGPLGPSRLRCLPRREPPRCRSTIRGLRSNGTIPTTDRCPMPSPEPTSICFGRGR